MNTLVFIINLVCWFLISKEGIKKTESGKLFIESIDTNTINLLKWRANSGVISDLKRLSRIFGLIILFGFGITIILALFHISPGFYFALTMLISLFIWTALMWGTNPKKETLDSFKYLGLFMIAPWFLYALDLITNDSTQSILQIFNQQIYYSFGFILKSEIEVTIFLTVILFLGMTIVMLYGFLQNSIIILLFVSILWLTIRISRFFLRVKDSTITNIAYILTPVTMLIMYFNK